jgi:hypothetical protein
MAEIRTVTTLTRKRAEIETAITRYEKALAQARADLAHVKAAIRIFEIDGEPNNAKPYVDLRRLFRYRELWTLAQQKLAHGPATTLEIARYVMEQKKLDTRDSVLVKAINFRVVQAMASQHMRGSVKSPGKVKGRRIWRLPGTLV